MKKLAPVIAGVVIVAALSLAVLAGGCGSGGDAAPDQAQNEPDEVCPDTLVEVDEIVFLSAANLYGQPSPSGVEFPAGTAVIHSVITLSQDLCCKLVTVVWQMGEETVYYWSEDAPADIGDSFTVSFARPEGGFTTGQYKVSVYIGIRELVNASFTVE
jgi:hypothetical protein